jgi:hypothetical protein
MAERQAIAGLVVRLCVASFGCGDLLPPPTAEPTVTRARTSAATATPTAQASATPSAEPSSTSTTEPSHTPTEPSAETPALPAECPAGRLEYTDDVFSYRICCPEEATLSQRGISSVPTDEVPQGMTASEYVDQTQAQYGERLCIGIRYGPGYVNVAASPNSEFHYAICGRTGVGTGTLNYGSETVDVQGMSYTAARFEFVCDTVPSELLDCHNETYVLHLPDNTRIECGAAASDTSTYADHLSATKDVLLQIVES